MHLQVFVREIRVPQSRALAPRDSTANREGFDHLLQEAGRSQPQGMQASRSKRSGRSEARATRSRSFRANRKWDRA